MNKKEMLILTISFVLIGILFLVIPPKILSFFYFPLVALGFIIMGIVKLVFLNKYIDTKKEFYFNLFEGIFAILFGSIYLHFFHNLIVDVVVFVFLAIIPLLRVIFAENRLNQIAFDTLKYIGLISLFGGYVYLNNIFFIISGIIWLILALVVAIYYFVKRRNLNGEEN